MEQLEKLDVGQLFGQSGGIFAAVDAGKVLGYVTHRRSFAGSSNVHLFLEGHLPQVVVQMPSFLENPGGVFTISGRVSVAKRFQKASQPPASEIFLFGINDTKLASQIKVHNVKVTETGTGEGGTPEYQCSFSRLPGDGESVAEFARVMDVNAQTFYLLRDCGSAEYFQAQSGGGVRFQRLAFPLPYALVPRLIADETSNAVKLADHEAFQPCSLEIAQCIKMTTMDRLITLTAKVKNNIRELHNYRTACNPKQSEKSKGRQGPQHSDATFPISDFKSCALIDHPHARRLLLSAECQIGKTGTYISLLDQLRRKILVESLPKLPEISEPAAGTGDFFEPLVAFKDLPCAVRWVYPFWKDLNSPAVPYFKIGDSKYPERIVKFRLVALLEVVATLKRRAGKPEELWAMFVEEYKETLRHMECIVSRGSTACLDAWADHLKSSSETPVAQFFCWTRDVNFDDATQKWTLGDLDGPREDQRALRRVLLRALDWDGRVKQCLADTDPFQEVDGDPTSWEQVFSGARRAQHGATGSGDAAAAGGAAVAADGRAGAGGGGGAAKLCVRLDTYAPDGCKVGRLTAEQVAESATLQTRFSFPSCLKPELRNAGAPGWEKYTLAPSGGRARVLGTSSSDLRAEVQFWIPDGFVHKEWVEVSAEDMTLKGLVEKPGGFRWIFNPTAFRARTALLDYSNCGMGEFAQVCTLDSSP